MKKSVFSKLGGTKKRQKIKKIRKRQRVTPFSKIRRRVYSIRHRIIWISAVCLLLVLVLFLLKKTVYAPRYTLNEIRYDQESIDHYNDPNIYSFINEYLLNRNYFIVKRFDNKDLLLQLEAKFPIIANITLKLQEDTIGYVTIDYHDPAIVFQLPEERRFASYKSSLYPLGTGDSIGDDVLSIQLPRYSADLPNIDGIFYKMSEEKLVTAVTTITETLISQNVDDIIYLPGGEKLFIAYKKKRVYIHLNKDINVQLAKLIDIENHYQEFNEISVIDLGSNDDTIVR